MTGFDKTHLVHVCCVWCSCAI